MYNPFDAITIIARSAFINFFFFLGCSSSHFFCQPTISIINEGKKRTKKLTKNLKITKYYDLSLVYKKVTYFFYILFLKLRRATHESRAEDACQLVDKSCVCICVTSQFSFFLSTDKKETRTWHTVSLIISWTLFSQSYLFFCISFLLSTYSLKVDDTLGRARGK